MSQKEVSQNPDTSQTEEDQDIQTDAGLQSEEGTSDEQEIAKPVGFTDEEWSTVPDEAKSAVSRREKDREAHFTKRSQQLAEQEKMLQNLMSQAKTVVDSSQIKEKPSPEEIPDLRDVDYQDPVQFQKWLGQVVGKAVENAVTNVRQDFDKSLSDREQKNFDEMANKIWDEFLQEYPEAKDLERDMMGIYLTLPIAKSESAMRKNLDASFVKAKEFGEFQEFKRKQAKSKQGPESSRGVNRGTATKPASPPSKTVKEAYEETIKEMKAAGLEVPEEWEK